MSKVFSLHIKFLLVILCTGLLSSLIAISALAQINSNTSPYRTGEYVGVNNVDLLTGTVLQSAEIAAIGSGQDGLSISVTTWTNAIQSHNQSNVHGWVNKIGAYYVVNIGGAAEEFTKSGSVYTPRFANGTTLTKSGNVYTYISAGGTTAKFDTAYKLAGTVSGANNFDHSSPDLAAVTSITAPTGMVLTYTYFTTSSYSYLVSLQNSLGYQLKMDFSSNTTAINNSVDYCDPALFDVAQCYLPAGRWESGTYTPPSGGLGTITSVTNAAGETTELSQELTSPASGEDISYTYELIFTGTEIMKRVTGATTGGGTWTYAYADAAGIRTTTVTAPDGGIRLVTSNISNGTVISDKDALGRTTSFLYDSNRRVTKITNPYTTSSEFTYDSRGNVTQVKQNPKAGSSNVSIITTASYPASCSNRKTCNKPVWTRDARGKQTDYTYNSSHGGVLTVTGPAPTSGAARPQVRYTYAQKQAKAKNSAGTLVNLSPVWRMTAVSTCSTGSSCSGTANETKILQAYSSTRNLIPTNRTVKSGNGSLSSVTASWTDWYGNPEYTDGPLSGTSDRTYFKYDTIQRLVGVIGSDPDGSGPRLRQAVRYTYSDGLLAKTETGTTAGTNTSAWNAFASLQTTETQYDSYGRPIKNLVKAGGSVFAVSQTSYDNKSRPICAALRMNPSVFGSLPTDACVHSTSGAFGADRIAKLEYNITDQVLKTTAGFGTTAASMEETTYYTNGNVKYRYDGNGNRTYYKFDPFNRSQFKYFPNTNGSGHNTSDYQRSYYDQYGRGYKARQRDGSLLLSSFDDLGRTTLINAPGTADDVSFTYDNFGRVLSTTKGSDVITSVYNALSQRLSETTANGTVSYQYDVAGRGTKITYPGSGLYVNYDYNVAGQVTKIRENGATSGIGVLAAYTYDNQGRRTSVTRGNGVVTNLGFDLLSRLTSLENNVSGTTNDQTLTFTHMASSQIATRTNSNSAYDWDGASILSESYSINGLNQVLSAAIGNITYDTRGNTVAAGSKTYGYDIFNQLTSAVGSGVNATMAYDPVGRMKQVTGSGVTTKFVYSGSQMIAETNSSGTTLRRYVHGPGVDEPIVWYEGANTSDRRWLMSDNQGSITAITNASGTVTHKNRYNEYGVPDTANTGRFQYTGQVWLAEADIYHYKARAYDPYLGRFLQTDPIGYAAGMNMYAYVDGDPVNWADPSGLQKEEGCEKKPPGTCIKRRRRPSIAISGAGFTFWRAGMYGAGVTGRLILGQINPYKFPVARKPQEIGCKPYSPSDFSAKKIEVNNPGGYPQYKKRGFLGFGPKAAGAYSTHDAAVQSAVRSLDTAFAGRASEGVTIFSNSSGYYTSRPTGAGGFSPGGTPSSSGRFWNADVSTSVMSTNLHGHTMNAVGNPFIIVEFGNPNLSNSKTILQTCRR